jgi:hypothetical protein
MFQGETRSGCTNASEAASHFTYKGSRLLNSKKIGIYLRG